MSDRKREHGDPPKKTGTNTSARVPGQTISPAIRPTPQNIHHMNRPNDKSTAHINSREHPLQKRRKIKKRKPQRIITIFAAAIATLFIIGFTVVKFRVGGGDVLKGKWNLDGITEYRFDGKGGGSLDLPDSAYPFAYEINDNSLIIDFDSEGARDVTYTFTVQNQRLVLVSIENGKEVTYELTKEEISRKQ